MNGQPRIIETQDTATRGYDTFTVFRVIMVGYPALWLCYLALVLTTSA